MVSCNAICFYFAGDSKQQLYTHLLKTLCTDIVNLLLQTMAADHMLNAAEFLNHEVSRIQ